MRATHALPVAAQHQRGHEQCRRQKNDGRQPEDHEKHDSLPSATAGAASRVAAPALTCRLSAQPEPGSTATGRPGAPVFAGHPRTAGIRLPSLILARGWTSGNRGAHSARLLRYVRRRLPCLAAIVRMRRRAGK